MPGQEVDHLAGHLQVGHPPVEIDPIEALQIQTDVPVQDVVHGHHAGRHRVPPGSGVSATPPACSHPTATSPANPTTSSAVRGEASVAISDAVAGADAETASHLYQSWPMFGTV